MFRCIRADPLRKGNLNIAKHSLDLSHTDFARGYSNSTSREGGGGERARARSALSLLDFRLHIRSHAHRDENMWARIDIRLSELRSSRLVILSGEKEENGVESGSLHFKLIADLFLE